MTRKASRLPGQRARSRRPKIDWLRRVKGEKRKEKEGRREKEKGKETQKKGRGGTENGNGEVDAPAA